MKGGREIPPPSMKERARLERESEWQEDFEAAERERERAERERERIHQLQLYRERIARQNEEIVNRRISEYRARMNSSACSILGGRVKNILQKKNKSNKNKSTKNKSKRVNKLVKNKRYSRKSLKKCLH